MSTITDTQLPAAGAYAADVSHSHVGFKVRHLMVSKVRGRFTEFEANAVIAEDPTASTLEVTVPLASIDTRDEGRDAHLRGPDFFDVEHHPTMTFRSNAVRHGKGDRWDVLGDLTIKGVTRPVTLAVTFDGSVLDPWGNQRAAFTATGEIDREDFGLTWNQPLETGGVLVGRKVELEIEAELVRQ